MLCRSIGKFEAQKVTLCEYGRITLYRADARLAEALPKLALPPMPEAARAAFRAVIDYEKPISNGSMTKCLALAEARGFSAQSGDQIPFFDQQVAGYQPGSHQPRMR